MFYWIVAITATFLLQVGNVYISNIIFFLWIIVRFFTKKEKYSFDYYGVWIYFLYLGWVLLSMILFSLQYDYLETRNLVQFAYNIQYVILIAEGSIDRQKLRQAMKVSAMLLSIVIIMLWIVKTGMMNIMVLVVNNREWAMDYIGGWPNSTILPLVFCVYLEMKEYASGRGWSVFRVIRMGLLLFALLLCTSRTGYIGGAVIIAYFLWKSKEGTGKLMKYLKKVVLFGCLLIVLTSACSLIMENDLSARMFMVSDRQEIMADVFSYVKERPISGYGGNSIDVVYNVVRPTESGMNWGHTHNTILELLIRHGIIGTLLFFAFVIRVYARVKTKDEKVMYWLFWGLSTFQIFYKDFVFLLLIFMLILPEEYESDAFWNLENSDW